MSRMKKARSAGNADVIIVRERSESDVDGRLRKKLKKRKGLKSGNRHSAMSEAEKRANTAKRDPRLGSKKKIPLIVAPKAVPTKEESLLLAEKELAQIEQDAQFNVLLDRLDNGEKLGAGLQAFVDQKLDRIEVLMKKLGLDIEDEEDEFLEEEQEAPAVINKPKSQKKSRDEEDLLADFEDLDLDEWKG